MPHYTMQWFCLLNLFFAAYTITASIDDQAAMVMDALKKLRSINEYKEHATQALDAFVSIKETCDNADEEQKQQESQIHKLEQNFASVSAELARYKHEQTASLTHSQGELATTQQALQSLRQEKLTLGLRVDALEQENARLRSTIALWENAPHDQTTQP